MTDENPVTWKPQYVGCDVYGAIRDLHAYHYVDRPGNRQAHMNPAFYSERKPIEYNAFYREPCGVQVAFGSDGAPL